jgi:tetratricopeptide (TPR) repeat protein
MRPVTRMATPASTLRSAVLVVTAAALAPLAGASPAPPGAVPPPPGETRAARDQARLCERLDGEPSIAACRAALELGIGPARRDPLRDLIAKKLVTLERWDELAEHFREGVRLHPDRAEVWARLGSTLLFATAQAAEALAAAQEAVRLAPDDASFRVLLATALSTLGRPADAAAAFEEALRLDPAVLDGRPAAQAVRAATQAAQAWP